MIHLKIPFRILLALFIIIYKTLVYLFGIVVMFIWFFNLKFVAKWTGIMYSNFLGDEVEFGRYSVVYKTTHDFIHNKKTIIKHKYYG